MGLQISISIGSGQQPQQPQQPTSGQNNPQPSQGPSSHTHSVSFTLPLPAQSAVALLQTYRASCQSQFARDVCDAFIEAAKTTKGVFANGDELKAVAKFLDTVDTVARHGGSVSAINAKVTDLEKTAPGTMKTVEALSKALESGALELDKLPAGLRNHTAVKARIDQFQATAAAAHTFTTDYNTYLNTPSGSWLNPFTWGQQASAGLTAQSSFQAMQTELNKLQKLF